MTLVVVLVLLSMALAVSYAMLRTQSSSVQIQGNHTRRLDSRQAALAGVAAGMQKMQQANWQGVGVSLSGQLDSNQWYEVSFETGDPSLTPSHPDYAKFPYRVTLVSTGYAADPASPNVRSIHKVRAVMQLVRRRMSNVPSNWSSLQTYTVYQWGNKDAQVQIPVRVEGPSLLQGRLRLCEDYPPTDTIRIRYLGDLESMRAAGLGDHRPFNGPLYLPYSRNNNTTMLLLQSFLKVPTNDIANSSSAPLSHPGAVNTYQLYPGGKRYSVVNLQSQYGSSLANVTLAADPQANPLGIFLSTSSMTFNDNVTLQGMLIASVDQADVTVRGNNVRLQALSLPPLDGTTTAVQLPVALLKGRLRVESQVRNGSLNGLAVAWDKFEFRKGDAETSFDLRGRLLTNELQLLGRDPWKMDASTWSTELTLFLAQLVDPLENSPVPYFPQWMEKARGLKVKPLLTVRRESSAVTYHWPDWSQPIYLPHPNDGGLRWDLVQWKDVP
jgi:hypothetical protein